MKHPLNNKEKTVIESIYIKEETPSQVAKALGITESRIYQIRIRALAKLEADRPNSKTIAEIVESGRNPQWRN